MAKNLDPDQSKQMFRQSQVAGLQTLVGISVENRAARRERKKHPRLSASILALTFSMMVGGKLPWHRHGRR